MAKLTKYRLAVTCDECVIGEFYFAQKYHLSNHIKLRFHSETSQTRVFHVSLPVRTVRAGQIWIQARKLSSGHAVNPYAVFNSMTHPKDEG